tara:strand:+ start:10341 stop:11060 length:720 start_codon:yes stop_codon:yes gene_type:complete
MTTVEARQPAGRPTGGQFAARERSESEAILNSPLVELGEFGQWKNGGQASGASIIESPVSDREHNYWLCLESGANRSGYINVCPSEFGVEHPELGLGNANDRLYVGTENIRGQGGLEMQYCAASDVEEYAEQVMELEANNELDAFESKILKALREETGDDNLDIIFSSGGEAWDDVSVIYNSQVVDMAPIHTVNPDGSIEASTSNLMAHLESKPAYHQVVHGRIGDAVIQRLMAERFND